MQRQAPDECGPSISRACSRDSHVPADGKAPSQTTTEKEQEMHHSINTKVLSAVRKKSKSFLCVLKILTENEN